MAARALARPYFIQMKGTLDSRAELAGCRSWGRERVLRDVSLGAPVIAESTVNSGCSLGDDAIPRVALGMR